MDGRLIIRNERVETERTLLSENPATLEPVGEVSVASREQCEQAIRAAKDADPVWRWLDHREKRAIFKRAENILARRAREVGRLIAMEKGSPYPESMAVEVFGALQSLNYYGHNQGRLLRARRAGHHTPLFLNKTGTFHFHPLAVAASVESSCASHRGR